MSSGKVELFSNTMIKKTSYWTVFIWTYMIVYHPECLVWKGNSDSLVIYNFFVHLNFILSLQSLSCFFPCVRFRYIDIGNMEKNNHIWEVQGSSLTNKTSKVKKISILLHLPMSNISLSSSVLGINFGVGLLLGMYFIST